MRRRVTLLVMTLLICFRGVQTQEQSTVIETQFARLPIGVNPEGQKVVILPFGAVLLSALWARPEIPVCWENPSAVSDAHRTLVREAVTTTWQRESRLRFTGWETCAQKTTGIRIRVADDGPHVKALGKYLENYPAGMVLNFTFANWSPSCQKKVDFCAWAIAVHEFGHAIGFAHEQNRPDAPAECRADSHQGTTGDWNVTTYDPVSIMNYCNPAWNNAGKLSDRDILAVRTIYGSPF